MAEYDRLKATLGEMAVQVDTMQVQIKNSNRASQSNQKHLDDVMKEK